MNVWREKKQSKSEKLIGILHKNDWTQSSLEWDTETKSCHTNIWSFYWITEYLIKAGVRTIKIHCLHGERTQRETWSERDLSNLT